MTRRDLAALRSVAFVVALGLAAGPARADAPGQDKALAEALFDQGVALLKKGEPAEACPKLAESQRLDPAPGTLLYLGDCYEKTGKLATAWATFREASASARAVGQAPREELAKKRAAILEKDLPYLALVGADKSGAAEVKLDGTPLGRALWDGEIPVDPGEHAVVVSAPGYETWRGSVKVGKGEHGRLAIPALEKTKGVEAPPPPPPRTVDLPPPPPPPIEDAPPRRWQRPVALGVAGAGIVGLGVGSFFGLRAFSKWSDAEAQCPADRCTGDGRALAESASSAATISTVSFVAGGVLVAGGAALFFMAPKSTRTGQLKVGVTGPGAVVEGRF